jgi:ribonuclease R
LKKDPNKKREAQNYENPIASREFILMTMEDIGVPASFKQLIQALDLEDNEGPLQNRLRAMVRDGQLVVDRRNIYAIASKMELVTGRVLAHADGFGFLQSDNRDEDVFLSNRQMRAVFHGDIAQVRIRGKDRRGRSEGEIIEVNERNTQQIVARLYYKGGLNLLESLNKKIIHEILVPGLNRAKYKPGQIVVANIIEQPSIHGIPTAEVIETLGDHLTPDMEVEVALRNQDIPFIFDDEVTEYVDSMPIEVSDEDKLNRRDLRNIPFVTIDGEDARDFDDAVYCEKKAGGGWRLFVAIADVAHYVELGSLLDATAFDRGTSVYFPQYVVPMLPEKLSNGLCSLKPDVDRLVMVSEITISAKGKISGYRFYEGVIHSHGRLTYTTVTSILKGDEEAQRKYKSLLPHLNELSQLFNCLQKNRQVRGALEFESRELIFDFDADGRVEGIRPTVRNDAHRLIEECMLCANVCAARFIEKHKIPGLYRVHEAPDEGKVEALSEFLSHRGINFNWGDQVTTQDYQVVLEQLRKRENGQVLQIALLRSMNQAVYQAENKGHFGLNYSEYAHFTSPIRRYPDLMMHRLIKSVIHSRKQSKYIERFGPTNSGNWYPYNLEDIVTIGERTSFTERRAESAVYDVLEWIKCDYINDQVGSEFRGVVTGVTKFGLFVELNDVFVEGLVHVSTLAGDYFHFDAASQSLVGERTHTTYSLADTLSVIIARVDVDERKVDFEITSDSSAHKGSGRRKKKVALKGRKVPKGKREQKGQAGQKPKKDGRRERKARPAQANSSAKTAARKKQSTKKSSTNQAPANKHRKGQ